MVTTGKVISGTDASPGDTLDWMPPSPVPPQAASSNGNTNIRRTVFNERTTCVRLGNNSSISIFSCCCPQPEFCMLRLMIGLREG